MSIIYPPICWPHFPRAAKCNGRRAFGISLGAALAQGTYNFDATITDIAGNTSGASSNYTVTINSNTTPPTVSSVVAPGAGITNGNGNLNAGKVVTLTVAFSAAVTVNTSGGTPTLALERRWNGELYGRFRQQ